MTVSPVEVRLHVDQSTNATVFVCTAVGNAVPRVRISSTENDLC